MSVINPELFRRSFLTALLLATIGLLQTGNIALADYVPQGGNPPSGGSSTTGS